MLTGGFQGRRYLLKRISEVDMHASSRAAAETRYRDFFAATDKGFCVVEVLFDDEGRAYDYRFLEVNDAFESHTGLRDAVGKTIRSLRPEHDEHWFRIYGDVAMTGEPGHVVKPISVLGRWFEVNACRVGPPERRQVAVLFSDVTEHKREEEHSAILSREIEHRARNMLSVFDALVRISEADTVADFRERLLGRLEALASSQERLSEDHFAGGRLSRLVEHELAACPGADEERVAWSGPDILLTPKATQTLAMVLHELAVNALKHGALSTASGRVSVEWGRTEDGQLHLHWQESGGPRTTPPSHHGIGYQVITRCIRDRFGGEVRWRWREEGIFCCLRLPTDAESSSGP